MPKHQYTYINIHLYTFTYTDHTKLLSSALNKIRYAIPDCKTSIELWLPPKYILLSISLITLTQSIFVSICDNFLGSYESIIYKYLLPPAINIFGESMLSFSVYAAQYGLGYA